MIALLATLVIIWWLLGICVVGPVLYFLAVTETKREALDHAPPHPQEKDPS